MGNPLFLHLGLLRPLSAELLCNVSRLEYHLNGRKDSTTYFPGPTNNRVPNATVQYKLYDSRDFWLEDCIPLRLNSGIFHSLKPINNNLEK